MNYDFLSFKSRPELEGPFIQRFRRSAGSRHPWHNQPISACPVAAPGCRGEGGGASQKCGHGDFARPAAVGGQEWLDGGGDRVAQAFEQTGLGALAAAIINAQVLAARIQRGPDILSDQPVRHGPVFFEDIDRTLWGDAAQEMNAPRSQRQGGGHLTALLPAQAQVRILARGLRHGLAVQRGRGPGLIPLEEAGTFAAHSAQRREVIFVPEAARPQPVETFNQAIAHGFAGRNEDQFNAQIQGQPYELSKDPGRKAQAGKGRVIVELQKVGQADPPTALQQMGTSRGGTLIGAQRLVQRIALPVHCVKGQHFVPARQIARNPITGLKDDARPWPGAKIIRGGLNRRDRRAPLHAQPAFERGQGGPGPEPMPAQFLLKGPWPAQPHARLLQPPPDAPDQRHRGRRVLLGRMVRSAGSRVESRPAGLLKAALPFEEPRTRAPKLVENARGRFPFIKEPEGYRTIPNFVSLFVFHPQTITPAL